MRGRTPIAGFAACLAVLLAACQAPLGNPLRGPDGGREDPRLAQADGRMFAGDYDAADELLGQLVDENVPGAGARYSTLLTYESRFEEAVAQAKAAAATRPDSETLARLCRALDWADQVDMALQAGSRAIAARPVSPLARAYYAEALADSGRLGEAESQLRQAGAMGGGAYVRAEIDREWSLVDDYRSDTVSQLNHILLAAKEQPGFPQRQVAVARYELAHNQTQAGSSVLSRLAGDHLRDYGVLVEVADSAFLAGDVNRAANVYSQANQVRPGGPEAAMALAEIAILNKDVGRAHEILLATLRLNPRAGEVYEFLRHLDLLVLKQDPGPELGAIGQEPGQLASARQAALQRANAARVASGLPALGDDPSLAAAAESHAWFYFFNLADPALAGAGIHGEAAADPGFTGADALARSLRFGYAGSRVDEVIGHALSPEAAVGDFVASIGQRQPLMSGEASVAGYGEARVGLFSISVMEIGIARPGAAPVVYPAPDQGSLPAFFNGGEPQDPLPDGTHYPVGYPVTLQVGDSQHLVMTSAQLTDGEGAAVPAYEVAPGSKIDPGEFALVAREPLKPGSRYTAHVTGVVGDVPISRTWSFTVAAD